MDASIPSSPSLDTHHLPTTPSPTSNRSSASFTLPDVTADDGTLPPEIANADISMSADGSFVETSSGSAARELKKRYDQLYGVNLNVRSPYAITAFINQHGKQMYRVGRRELQAPAAKAEEQVPPASTVAEQPRNKRRSRLSVHGFAKFKNNSNNPAPSRPQTTMHSASSAIAPRKLRKARSIPDMPLNGDQTQPAPTPTGRQHSQSVTAADMPRFLPTSSFHSEGSHTDMFWEVMDWSAPLTSSHGTPSMQSVDLFSDSSRPINSRPFGPGVSFTSPSKKKTSEYLLPPVPRLLREMQSFDSVLTARQETPEPTDDKPKLRHPPSMLLLHPEKNAPTPSSSSTVAELATQPQYPTSVFDVLQTYRGLPMIDKLLDDGEDTTIKISSTADESIAPRDDPRFVIWGDILPEERGIDDSISQLSQHGSSTRSASLSRKRGKSATSVCAPEAGKRVLLAATIERWIAQLTSDLNYDDLLDFFLTYRTYVNAVDLFHLLVSRFHWTLEQPKSSKDEMVRRIVRVRTFVAFKFWLNKFFAVDFLPNRELRLLLANWLNALVRDPILKAHRDGLNTVKKLRKVVKDCKKSHLHLKSESSVSEPSKKPAPHLLGERFAEAIKRTEVDDEGSDIDLDFYAEGGSDTESSYADPINAQVSSGFSPNRPPTTVPLSSMAILKQTVPNPTAPLIQSPATLPVHHGAFSRVFVKTIGRLGRWKRVLNSQPTMRTPVGSTAEVSAFDLELTVTRDLLTVNGGVEQYLKLIEPPAEPVVQSPTVPRPQSVTPISVPSVAVTPEVKEGDVEETPSLMPDGTDTSQTLESSPMSTKTPLPAPSLRSFRSNSTDSFGVPISVQPSEAYPWSYDVAPIDEVDLSDTSSDEETKPGRPPGLRTARKLPLRRDFEFVQRESVSSMGITSRDSIASSEASEASMPELGAGPIQQWQVNAIVASLDDDEEEGDVEAALKRLEGEINPERQREKQSKVDGWVQSIRRRMLIGDFGDEQPRFPIDSDDDGGGEADTGNVSTAFLLEPFEDNAAEATTPLATQTSHPISSVSNPGSPTHAGDARPVPEDVVPFEILQSRMPSMPVVSEPHLTFPPPKSLGGLDIPRTHRSFVLAYRAESLVEHFSMIDRELFMGVKFEELVLDSWMTCEEVDVLDWTQFLRDRARWKAESRLPQKTSALAAVRARFNLVSNFCISEIILTRPNERAVLVDKFIRIAWKAYSKSNFSTLVAIIAALKSEWVSKAMRRYWPKVGLWEMRIYNDLKEYITHMDSFKYIRAAIDAIAEREQPQGSGNEVLPNTRPKTNTGDRLPPPSACIPFIGVYLSQLHEYSRLPDLIDPTAPTETVSIDPITSNFNAPVHPEVFDALPPLPPSMQLEPLINVHKQRLIAGVIKSLVIGQHLARRVQFPIDKKLFQKCLKLRGLTPETLSRALAMYSD